MHHWEFLEKKLGRDVSKYIIQPMVGIPHEDSVIRATKAFYARVVKQVRTNARRRAFDTLRRGRRKSSAVAIWSTVEYFDRIQFNLQLNLPITTSRKEYWKAFEKALF